MALSPKIPIGIFLVLPSIALFVFGLLSLLERFKFDPFFTSIECTHVHVQIPIARAAYPMNTDADGNSMPLMTLVGFPSITEITEKKPTLTVAIDKATGKPLIPGMMDMQNATLNHIMTNLLQYPTSQTNPAMFTTPPSEEAYKEAAFLPKKLQCTNPSDNNFKVSISDASQGIIEIYSPELQKFVQIGEIAVLKDISLNSGETKVGELGMKLRMPGELMKASSERFDAGLTIPFFFTFTTLKTKIEMSYMFMDFEEEDKVPLKYCGLHVKRQALPTPHLAGYHYDMIMPASKTFCRDSKGEISKLLMPTDASGQQWLQSQLAADMAPTEEMQTSKGFADHLDPTTSTIEESESKLDKLCAILVLSFWLPCCIFGVVAGFLIFKGMKEKKGEKSVEASGESVETSGESVENGVAGVRASFRKSFEKNAGKDALRSEAAALENGTAPCAPSWVATSNDTALVRKSDRSSLGETYI